MNDFILLHISKSKNDIKHKDKNFRFYTSKKFLESKGFDFDDVLPKKNKFGKIFHTEKSLKYKKDGVEKFTLKYKKTQNTAFFHHNNILYVFDYKNPDIIHDVETEYLDHELKDLPFKVFFDEEKSSLTFIKEFDNEILLKIEFENCDFENSELKKLNNCSVREFFDFLNKKSKFSVNRKYKDFYEKIISDSKVKSDSLIFYKQVDYSFFKYGTAIPVEFHKIVDEFISHKLKRGEIFETQILLLDKKYDCFLTIPANKSKTDQYQLRYKDSSIVNQLKSIFINSFQYILENKNFNLLKGNNKNLVKTIYDDYIKIKFCNDEKTISFEPLLDQDILNSDIEKLYTIDEKEINENEKLFEELSSKTPEKRKRYIEVLERGNISNKVKKDSGYKCQICEVLGLDPLGFKKKNSDEYYVEAHHVTPVASQKKGILHPRNLICVCANHHRQIHYGNVELLKSEEDKFIFKIEEKIIEVKRYLKWKI